MPRRAPDLKSRRAGRIGHVVLVAAVLLGGGVSAQTHTQTRMQTEALTAEVRRIAETQMQTHRLNALLVEVLVAGQPAVTLALGAAMTGVPATPDSRFRNGAVALSYVAALALRLAEDGVIDLDVPVARWLPEFPHADRATIRMLANMTAGYPDHVADIDRFVAPFLADPFRHWSPDDLIAISLASPRRFAPGENWDYSHSGYVILGRVLEAATGRPLRALMQDHLLDPLGLVATQPFDTPQIPPPVLHAFTAERGVWEDATHWSPSWTLPEGAIQVTTLAEMARSFDVIVGHDGFLTPDSRRQMIAPVLVGFGAPLPGCPTCQTLTADRSYGLGAMLAGDWVFQTPQFAGYAAAVGTLPDEHAPQGRITVAAVATFTQHSVADWGGDLPNRAFETVRLIAAALVPDNPPPGP